MLNDIVTGAISRLLIRNSSYSASNNNNNDNNNNKKESSASSSIFVVLEYGLIEVIFLSLMFAAFLGCFRLLARRDRRIHVEDDILYDPILMSDEMTDIDEYSDNHEGGSIIGSRGISVSSSSSPLRDVVNRRSPSAVELISQP